MKIVIAGRADAGDVEALRAAHPGVEFQVVKHEGHGNSQAVLAALPEADALYIHTVTPEMHRAATRLRWVQSQGAGVEWLAEAPEFAASEVVLTNTRGAHAATIAEHAFGLLLSLTRCLPELREAQVAHGWRKPSRPVGLSGLTFGVIGLGNIGRAIAQRAAGFDMRVIAVDANDVPVPAGVARVDRLDGLEALLRESDVVAVSVPHTPETRGLLNGDRLARLKPSAYLLVVSRGGIVDEAALAAALRAGRLAGAGLDVTEEEPLSSGSPLWDVPNLLLTPHCSGASVQTRAAAWRIFEQNVGRFVRGEPLENVVEKGRGY